MPFGTNTAWSNAGWSNATAWADAEASAQRIAADERDLQQRFWRKLRRLAARLPFAEDLIAAHYCAFDRRTPLRVKAALVGALAYFVLPADVIPDVLPLIGYSDDAAVLAAAISLSPRTSRRITARRRDARWTACARRQLIDLADDFFRKPAPTPDQMRGGLFRNHTLITAVARSYP
jgi:uncharacterized membrane protein YkvA (DUF1232 family)